MAEKKKKEKSYKEIAKGLFARPGNVAKGKGKKKKKGNSKLESIATSIRSK